MSLHRFEADTDVVTAEFGMVSISGQVEENVTATLSYRAAEPFLVRATFTLPGARPVEWVLARELLREGIALPTGLGDVRIFPGDEGLLLELRSNQGRAFLYGPIEPVVGFVQQVYTLVPENAEHEHFSIDTELQTLVGSWTDPDRHISDSA